MLTVASEKEKRFATGIYIGYLLNITLLPILGFLIQIILWKKSQSLHSHFVQQHVRQSLIGSVLAGILLACVSLLILMIGSLHSPWTWIVLILYITLCHSLMILLGVLAYTRANAGKSFVFLSPKSWWS